MINYKSVRILNMAGRKLELDYKTSQTLEQKINYYLLSLSTQTYWDMINILLVYIFNKCSINKKYFVYMRFLQIDGYGAPQKWQAMS